MTNNRELVALAQRVEQATGPDRELWDLDRAIKAALLGREYISYEDDLAKRQAATPPRYTTSLDAAMTLVPEGSIWEVGHKVNYPAAPREPDRANYAFVNVGLPGKVKSFTGKSVATPALALCAAALRSKATTPTSEGA